jgi:hypothetical protein
MTIRFLRLAQKELDDAVEWYNQQSPGMGLKFLDKVIKSLNSDSHLSPILPGD